MTDSSQRTNLDIRLLTDSLVAALGVSRSADYELFKICTGSSKGVIELWLCKGPDLDGCGMERHTLTWGQCSAILNEHLRHKWGRTFRQWTERALPWVRAEWLSHR